MSSNKGTVVLRLILIVFVYIVDTQRDITNKDIDINLIKGLRRRVLSRARIM